jgi:hypothetical protein
VDCERCRILSNIGPSALVHPLVGFHCSSPVAVPDLWVHSCGYGIPCIRLRVGRCGPWTMVKFCLAWILRLYISVFTMHCLAVDDPHPCLFQPLSGVCFASKAHFTLPGVAEAESRLLSTEVADQETVEVSWVIQIQCDCSSWPGLVGTGTTFRCGNCPHALTWAILPSTISTDRTVPRPSEPECITQEGKIPQKS